MSDAAGPKVGLMNIGEEAKPPFAVLPDPSSIFLNRAQRLATLAPTHELEPYLRFVGTVTQCQHDIQASLPPAQLPSFDKLGQALEHGMPPLSRSLIEPDHVVEATLSALIGRLGKEAIPAQTAAALESLRSASADERGVLAAAVLKEENLHNEDLARRALVTAALQVHFARLATQLNADDLKPIADGVCPSCGSGPMTSSVVGWPKAHNTRFCTCALCSTMWNVVRVKCVLCSSTEGISYRSIDGKPDTVKAETCDKCHRYVKILYQVNDHVLEPLADDVATLGLDILLAGEEWKRGGYNPFLLGY